MSILPNFFRKKMDRHEMRVMDNVRNHGCQVQFVFDPDGQEPDFSYSIGFPISVQQPEVIVFGLARELMHSMVNAIRQDCKGGMVLADGMRIAGLLEGFDCVARHVTDKAAIEKHLGWAIWYHRSQHGREMTEAPARHATNGGFCVFDGAGYRIRTDDLPLTRRLLYQLS